MVCGEPLAFSAMLTTADFFSADTGLNVTDTVKLAPAGSVSGGVDPRYFGGATRF